MPNFSLLSFIPICSNVPSPNPLKCILLVPLLNRRRLLSISLTDETPICLYPLCHVSCQFPYTQFWPFPFVPCHCFMSCPCPCLKCVCPKCDVLCSVLYIAQSLSKICPVQMCPVYIPIWSCKYCLTNIFINPHPIHPSHVLTFVLACNTPFCSPWLSLSKQRRV